MSKLIRLTEQDFIRAGCRIGTLPDEVIADMAQQIAEIEDARFLRELEAKAPFILRNIERVKRLPWRKRMILKYRRWKRDRREEAKWR